MLWDCITWGLNLVWGVGSGSFPEEVTFKVRFEKLIGVSQGTRCRERFTNESKKISDILRWKEAENVLTE